MARGKKTKLGGKARGAPRKGSNGRNHIAGLNEFNSQTDFDRKPFTLRDAARNSEHPGSFWASSAQQLRNRQMHFIPSSDPPQDSQKPHQRSRKTNDAQNGSTDDAVQTVHPVPYNRDSNPEKGFKERNVAMERAARLAGPDVDTSLGSWSDEEILFTGRTKPSGNKRVILTPPTMQVREVSEQISDAFATVEDLVSLEMGQASTRVDTSKDRRLKQRGKRPRGHGPRTYGRDRAEEAALDDYIANTKDRHRISGHGMDVDIGEVSGAEDTDNTGWATEELQDFDNMSTSEEILEAVAQVLSKRQRQSGLQYLIVWQGQSVDEARWIPHASLPLSALNLIASFEEAEARVPEFIAHEEESESEDESPKEANEEDDDSEESFALDWDSDENPDLNYDLHNDNESEDDDDLLQRRMNRMTDEHIARLLQKQESLGIFSDNLEIFDGLDEVRLSDHSASGFDTTVRSSRKKSHQRAKRRQKPSFFAEADELLFDAADSYGEFDVVYRDRPSVENGKLSDFIPFQLSDSDMANDLRDAWAADRKKKGAKKAEREQLRAQGLLGKKNKLRPDLRARYNDGMSISSLEHEFRDFLLNGQQAQLSLPPMDKRDRKIIHDIANAFGLRSKSQGSGKKRFPMIFKTSRTAEFDDKFFRRLKGQLNERFVKRMDKNGRGKSTAIKQGSGGFTGKSSAYREGEIVGAGASEIGSDNRGRAMLEKMGWSKGTALGALGSQGILLPIEHIVKHSKAGL